MDIPRRNNLKNNNLKNRISRDKCPGRPCSALRHLDRILLFPINVWVTENGGNTEIQPGFVADVLQTLSLSQRKLFLFLCIEHERGMTATWSYLFSDFFLLIFILYRGWLSFIWYCLFWHCPIRVSIVSSNVSDSRKSSSSPSSFIPSRIQWRV